MFWAVHEIGSVDTVFPSLTCNVTQLELMPQPLVLCCCFVFQGSGNLLLFLFWFWFGFFVFFCDFPPLPPHASSHYAQMETLPTNSFV